MGLFWFSLLAFYFYRYIFYDVLSCILRGGQHLVEVSQKKDFPLKCAFKKAFLGDTNLDQVTLEGAGTPNFSSTNIFDMFHEKLWA